MAWLPLSRYFSRHQHLVLKRRARKATRLLYPSRISTPALIVTLTAICIILLSLSNPRPHSVFPLPPSEYWHFSTVTSADLPPHSYPPPHHLNDFIVRAVRYIIRANSPTGDGKFIYKYELSEQALSVSSSYNTLRHSGAAYALADACLPADAAYEAHCRGARGVLQRSARWLLGTAKSLHDRPHIVGLWSRPSDENPSSKNVHRKKGEVRTGGIGLGLVALTAGARAGAAEVTSDILSAVARFATDVMQRTDGGFQSYFDERSQKVDPSRFNRFYAGEAALGLARLYLLNGNVTLLEHAARALENLAEERANVDEGKEIPCDHWALIATAALVRDARIADDKSVRGKERTRKLLLHARSLLRVCAARDRRRMEDNAVKTNNFGCGVEAQMNVLPLLAEMGEGAAGIGSTEAEEVFCIAQRTVGSILTMQYRWEDEGVTESEARALDGAVSGSGSLRVVDGEGGRRRERRSFDGVFQIDTTQHTLSAVLAYIRVCKHPLFREVRCESGGQPYQAFVRDGMKVKV